MIICLNLHFAVVNFLNLTLEGVESNPGPSRFILVQMILIQLRVIVSVSLKNFAIKKSIQATHYQGHLNYRESAGMQCTSNAYFSIAYYVTKKLSFWKSCDLDYILEKGDILFKSVGVW